MSSEESKRIIREYFDQMLNGGSRAAAERLLAPDFVCHTAEGGTMDHAAYTQSIVGDARTAFPDARYEPQEIIAEDDHVAVRFTLSGTHQGPWRGIPATGKRVHVLSICTYRVAGGQIAEKWLLADSLGMLRQLGALPALQQATA